MIPFLLGLFLGGAAGVVIVCACVAAGRYDRGVDHD